MKFLKQVSLYSAVSFLGAGINFFLMPFLSHYLSPADYGILSILNSFVTIVIPLVGLVASSILIVEYFRIKDPKEFSSFFSSVQLVPLIPALVFVVTLVIFPVPVCNFLELPVNQGYWLALSVLLAVLTIYYETVLMISVAEKKPWVYAGFNILKLIFEIGLTVLFVAVWDWGWEGRMWSWFITSVLVTGVSFLYFNHRRLLTANIKKQYIIIAIMYGLPLILHTIGKFVINQSNRVFIAKMVSVEEAGIYNIGAQVGMIILLLINAIGNFYSPFVYERLQDLDVVKKMQIIKVTYSIIGILILCLLGITLITPLFFGWLIDPKYASGAAYVFWVGLGYFFWGIYILFSSFIYFKHKTKFLGALAVINVALSIGMNYFFIKTFSGLGAAYATCLSFMVVAFIVTWKAVKLVPLPWLYFVHRDRLGNSH